MVDLSLNKICVVDICDNRLIIDDKKYINPNNLTLHSGLYHKDSHDVIFGESN